MLVLGPDSSVSPLILAAITPLLVAGGDPGPRSPWPGCSPLLVGLIEIGLGLGKLGFVADLLSSEVQVGYMNGLAVTIIVGQLPKLFGFSTDADGFFDEVEAFVDGPRRDGRDDAASSASRVLAVLLVLPRVTRRCRRCWSPSSAPPSSSAVLDLADEGVATVGALPQGVPTPTLPWTELERRRAAARRGASASRWCR